MNDVWEEIAAVPNCLMGLVKQIVAIWLYSAAGVKLPMSDESVMRSGFVAAICCLLG